MVSGRKNSAHMVGVSVSEMTAEMTMAKLNVTANSCSSRPIRPCINSSGMKTAMRDMLMEMTVKPICLAPLSAASNGESPASTNLKMFSITTMASSTTKPTEMVSAMSERLSKL